VTFLVSVSMPTIFMYSLKERLLPMPQVECLLRMHKYVP